MSKPTKSIKKETLVIAIALSFICGFLAGTGFAVYKLGPEDTSHDHPQTNTAPSNEETQAITNLEAEVTANPNNFQAWTSLGNLYYDTGQYQNAIGAYNKSLDLHSGTANILTDLGVMYRRTKQPEKAIEAFDKAIAMDPNHQFSRMNKGIVQYYDLGDVQRAISTWEGLLSIHPDAKTASGDSIRDFVDHIKDEFNKQQTGK